MLSGQLRRLSSCHLCLLISKPQGQGVLGEKIQSLDEGQGVLKVGQGVLGEKIQSLEKKLEKAETWRLGMNINPADGHIFGYTVGKK